MPVNGIFEQIEGVNVIYLNRSKTRSKNGLNTKVLGNTFSTILNGQSLIEKLVKHRTNHIEKSDSKNILFKQKRHSFWSKPPSAVPVFM